MLKFILVPALALSLLSVAPNAEAKPGGCLKYGAAGAVAGHYAHHGIAGAVAGCALGIHKRREYKRQMRMQQQSAAPVPTQRSVAPGTQPRAY